MKILDIILNNFFSLSRNSRAVIKFSLIYLIVLAVVLPLWVIFKPLIIKKFIFELFLYKYVTIKMIAGTIESFFISVIVFMVLCVGFYFRKNIFYGSWKTENIENMFNEIQKSGGDLIAAVHQLQESETQCRLLAQEGEKTKQDAIMKRRALREIIDLIPMLIFAKDDLGRFFIANKKIGEIYGVHPKELIGKTDADFSKKKDEIACFLSEDQKVIHGNERRTLIETITDCNGQELKLKTWKLPFKNEKNEMAVLGVSMILD